MQQGACSILYTMWRERLICCCPLMQRRCSTGYIGPGTLAQVLEKFSFQSNILSAIMALYSTLSAQVKVSGLLSKPFNITNGTRQGCSLSSSVFNLIIEPLADVIHSHPGITGFNFHNSVHNINLFEDGIILLVTNPESLLPQIFETFTHFSQISYYKMNAAKSLILDLGVRPPLNLYFNANSPSLRMDPIPGHYPYCFSFFSGSCQL